MKALLSLLKKAEVTELLCKLYYLVSLRCTFCFLIQMQLIEFKREYFPLEHRHCWSFWFIMNFLFVLAYCDILYYLRFKLHHLFIK